MSAAAAPHSAGPRISRHATTYTADSATASMKARGFEKKARKVGAVWIGLMLLGGEEDESF